MAIGDRVDAASLAALRAGLAGVPGDEELARRRAWVEAVKRARVTAEDFDVVRAIREMRDRPADASEYADHS